MIHESYYWKIELYKSFQILSKFRFLKKISEKSYVKIEKAILFGAYIVRKLHEAQKIPPDFLLEEIEITKHSLQKDKIVDHMNSHRIDRNYDLSKSTSEKRDYSFIINQLIHSFNIVYSFDGNNRFDGIFFNSDRSKNEYLYFINLKDILYLFLKISEGDITSASWIRMHENKSCERYNIGPAKITSAMYSYPFSDDLESIIIKTLLGYIYVRDDNLYR